jgi:hypothetical protein
MSNLNTVGALTAITASHHPIEQVWTPPFLARHHHQPRESLLYASAYLGLLLCRKVGFCLLISIGLHLVLHTVTVELQGVTSPPLTRMMSCNQDLYGVSLLK